jgi:hypothetical protein
VVVLKLVALETAGNRSERHSVPAPAFRAVAAPMVAHRD